MELILMLLIPVVQIILIKKRINGKNMNSIFGITLLMILATIPVGIITIALCEYDLSFRKEPLKCDPTIPGVIGIALLMSMFVIPVIGLIGRAMLPRKTAIPPAPENNKYNLKQSYLENIT
jgi:hypothetical protein